eukprot:TRINITY_DN68120_c1_g4_i2.p1 TRINITY_DN68120_c1_g4~~TRINITY_DN68120_c1_g4_i2.p1  ORF type:complete len:194 (-),score=14.54 TRINITY_DN68120_c1_g4_i2:18-599(-)
MLGKAAECEATDERFLYPVYKDVLGWLGYGTLIHRGDDTAAGKVSFGFRTRSAGYDGLYLKTTSERVIICVEVKNLTTHLTKSKDDQWHPLGQIVLEMIGAAQRNGWKDPTDLQETQPVAGIIWCGYKVGVVKMNVSNLLCHNLYRYHQPSTPCDVEVWYPKAAYSVRGADLRTKKQRAKAFEALRRIFDTLK